MKKTIWFLIVLGVLLTGVGLLGIPTSMLTAFIRPESYVSRARLIVNAPPPTDPRNTMKPVPNWLETEIELILSQRVLTNVVANLHLSKAWAERFKDENDLPPEVCVALLKRQIEFRQVKNTTLIEISVSSENRVEAAQIANEIAAVHARLRGEDARAADPNRGIAARPVEIMDRAEPAFRAAKSPLGLMLPGLAISVLLLLAGIGSLVAARFFGRDKATPPPMPR